MTWTSGGVSYTSNTATPSVAGSNEITQTTTATGNSYTSMNHNDAAVDEFGLGTQWWASATFVDRKTSTNKWAGFEMFFNGVQAGGANGYRGSVGAGLVTDSGTQFRLMSDPRSATGSFTAAWGNGGAGFIAPVGSGDGVNQYIGYTGHLYYNGSTDTGVSAGSQRLIAWATSSGSAVPTNKNATSLANSGVGTLLPRKAGNIVTVTMGKRADGNMEYQWIVKDVDTSITTTVTFLNTWFDTGLTPVQKGLMQSGTLAQLELRQLGAVSGDVYTWLDFS
ncbi:MAG: hypothetical protein K8S99_09070 [Planctomycetes bacterium]|nr:hypothetical protein [Planctomycetota bacterium]